MFESILIETSNPKKLKPANTFEFLSSWSRLVGKSEDKSIGHKKE